MARPIGKSPYTLDSNVYHFPEVPIGNSLEIRVESGGSFKVYLTDDDSDPSTTNAGYFLDSGDAICIPRGRKLTGKGIRIKAITGTPLIFYSIK
jgi:hypothetical protein